MDGMPRHDPGVRPTESLSTTRRFDSGAIPVGIYPTQAALPRVTASIAEQIADHLGRAIMERRYRAGEQLKEQAIAEQFAVSRGPVRDALKLLERQGFAEIAPRRGAFVVELVLDDFIDIFNIRAMLLSLAVRYLASNPDKSSLATLTSRLERLRVLRDVQPASVVDFVMALGGIGVALVRSSGNRQLAQVFGNLSHNTLWSSLWRSESPYDYDTPERREQAVRDYEQVVDAIAASDPDRGERLMRKIMREAGNAVIARMQAAEGRTVPPYRLGAI
ncbi:MAG TPA: GntR family transcriptional regulator [Burkholderiaceae bacterium]|nr:GntR family transcriptional regulator [Burkholderiaceae bacterium]